MAGHNTSNTTYDVVILGAGAAGMACARECAARGRRTLVLDHGEVPGNKIRVSGGGRCNCTNTTASAADYACANPHFVKSALARYTPWDFLDFMHRSGLPTHDEGRGMVFSDKAAEVAEALHKAALDLGAAFLMRTVISTAARDGDGHDNWFRVDTDRGAFRAASLVLALGGPSWPQVGATNFGYALAKSLGLRCTKTRPGLVPLLAGKDTVGLCAELSGISLPVRLSLVDGRELAVGSLLFTHKGISGPAVLNASLHWREGRTLLVDLLPGVDLAAALAEAGNMAVKNALGLLLPKRLAARLCELHGWEGNASGVTGKRLEAMEAALHAFPFRPKATAGFARAEVTLGGVDTDQFSSKTMEAKDIPGLYCIGELLDVTGRLGGYNLQWAWSSGYAAGQWA